MLLLEWFVEVDVIQEGPSSDAAAVFVSFVVVGQFVPNVLLTGFFVAKWLLSEATAMGAPTCCIFVLLTFVCMWFFGPVSITTVPILSANLAFAFPPPRPVVSL